MRQLRLAIALLALAAIGSLTACASVANAPHSCGADIRAADRTISGTPGAGNTGSGNTGGIAGSGC